MKCPKCGYHSFDTLENCKKCGRDLTEHKARFGLRSFSLPGRKKSAAAEEPPAEGLLPEPVSGDPPFGLAAPTLLSAEGPTPIPLEEAVVPLAPEVAGAPGMLQRDGGDAGPDDFFAPFEEKGAGSPDKNLSGPEPLPLLEEEADLGGMFLDPLPPVGEGPAGDHLFRPEDFVPPAERSPAADELQDVGTTNASCALVGGAPELPPPPAPLARRLAAGGADLLVLGLIFIPFVMAGGLLLSPAGGDGPLLNLPALLDLSIPYFLVFFAVAFGYFTLFHFLTGQTPGKMLVRLRVEGPDGEPLLFSQAFLRSVGGLLSLLAAGIGFLLILFDPARRGWNDRLAESRVVALEGDALGEEPVPAGETGEPA